MKLSNIRNFSIIAHIDHGKSTISDRIIELCGALEKREMQNQILDSMEIEKERGITIKSQTVRLEYKANNGEIYILNLMDTPGHVDFAYEVSRCLAACEGSLLVVDAAQGVEAQTLANVYKALEENHEIIPVLNKIDLPAANIENVKQEIEDIIGLDASAAIPCSAKTGIGIKEILESIIQKIPAPQGQSSLPLKALLVDAWYDSYLGVIILVRVIDGTLKVKDRIKMIGAGKDYEIEKIGIFTPKKVAKESLIAGEVGFLIANMKDKDIKSCKVGDTIVGIKDTVTEALPGFKPSQVVVFCGLFPADASIEFEAFKDALNKLSLNDSSFTYIQETSAALGLGFRCGFLGLLHLEIVQERLFREHNIEVITTAPSVIYKILKNNGTEIEIYNPVDFPDPVYIKQTSEPWIRATILTPETYIGNIITLCQEKRGEQVSMNYAGARIMLIYDLPLNEVVFDFYDKLKSYSSGYASFEWEITEYRLSDLVNLHIMVNGEDMPELGCIVHRSNSQIRGRSICEKLKDLVPRQMFEIKIQAAIGAKIIASERISALRKDVTAKCYGGDASRKKKLLEKQKRGKNRMREVGNVNIPHSAFIEALKT